MLRRVVLTFAVVLVAVTTASAQAQIQGVVSHVDPVTRTIHLTDGRTVQLDAGSTLFVDGRQRPIEYVRPGMNVAMLQSPAQGTTITTITQQTQLVPQPPVVTYQTQPVVQTLAVPVSSSPISVTGTIARVDPAAQTLTFQDGRIVRLGAQSMVWQQAPGGVGTLQPGMQVHVRDATPVGFVPTASAATHSSSGQWVMGTVSRFEPGAQQVVLQDGTTVHIGPMTTVRAGSERVAVTTLRPGDEVVLFRPATTASWPAAHGLPTGYQTPSGVAVTTVVPADRYAGSALPYQSYADTRIDASDVYILWSPQSR